MAANSDGAGALRSVATVVVNVCEHKIGIILSASAWQHGQMLEQQCHLARASPWCSFKAVWHLSANVEDDTVSGTQYLRALLRMWLSSRAPQNCRSIIVADPATY